MKQIVCIVFSTIILFTPVYNAAVWLNYELNKEKIAEAYCENKNQPELHCEGSCHVQKMLVAQEPELNQENTENWVPSMSRSIVYLQSLGILNSPKSEGYTIILTKETAALDEWYSDIFRPPVV